MGWCLRTNRMLLTEPAVTNLNGQREFDGFLYLPNAFLDQMVTRYQIPDQGFRKSSTWHAELAF